MDQNGAAVSGAAVNASITCSSVATAYGGTKTTDSQGRASFKITNAPKGTWTTLLKGVSKSGFEWDGSHQQTTFTSR